MIDEEIIKKLYAVLSRLYCEDYILIENECCERSIVFRIGIYLNEVLKDKEFNVDCEYNKLRDKPKSLMRRRLNYPDIIIHKRDKNENYLIAEVKTKKSTNKKSLKNDVCKLIGFTREMNYKYNYGVHIYISKNECNIVWYHRGNIERYDKLSVNASDGRHILCREISNFKNMNTFDKFYKNYNKDY